MYSSGKSYHKQKKKETYMIKKPTWFNSEGTSICKIKIKGKKNPEELLRTRTALLTWNSLGNKLP